MSSKNIKLMSSFTYVTLYVRSNFILRGQWWCIFCKGFKFFFKFIWRWWGGTALK